MKLTLLMSKEDLFPDENERLYELGKVIFLNCDNLIKLKKLTNYY